MQRDLLNDSRDCSALIMFGREFHNLAQRYEKFFFKLLDLVFGVSVLKDL